MGFWNKVGQTVSDAGQKTAQKTKEIAEISRINSLISQNESKINSLYYQIGKLYVSIHGNDGENEFRGMVESVIELEQQIEGLRNQIQVIKGVQRCEKCGAEVPRGAAFCSSCGSPMPRVEKETNNDDYVKCTSCGNLVLKGMRFCTSCGHAMTMPEIAPTANTEMDNAGGYPEIEEHIKVCPNCGEKLADDSIFCPECGNRL